MLKTTRLPNKPAFNKKNSSKLASSRKNNSKLFSRKNDDNNEDDEFSINKNDVKYAKKPRKWSKLRKSKSEKTSKSQNLATLGKKLLKSWNSTNFDATKAGPKFLTPDAKTALNGLWLAFNKAPILRYFGPKCYI